MKLRLRTLFVAEEESLEALDGSEIFESDLGEEELKTLDDSDDESSETEVPKI